MAEPESALFLSLRLKDLTLSSSVPILRVRETSLQRVGTLCPSRMPRCPRGPSLGPWLSVGDGLRDGLGKSDPVDRLSLQDELGRVVGAAAKVQQRPGQPTGRCCCSCSPTGAHWEGNKEAAQQTCIWTGPSRVLRVGGARSQKASAGMTRVTEATGGQGWLQSPFWDQRTH